MISRALVTRRVHYKNILRRLAGSRRSSNGRNSSERTLQNTENSPKFFLIRLPIPPTGPLGGRHAWPCQAENTLQSFVRSMQSYYCWKRLSWMLVYSVEQSEGPACGAVRGATSLPAEQSGGKPASLQSSPRARQHVQEPASLLAEQSGGFEIVSGSPGPKTVRIK